MSITKTLYTGVAGITAHGEALGVVGDNIANVNTIGYKSEKAVFSDLLGRSIMAVDQPGSGAQLEKITRTFAQGTLLTTESPTDLAINGRGFFVVKGQVSAVQTDYYTRAGQFALSKEGSLVNPQGFVVQGYLVDQSGNLDNQLTDLKVADSILLPASTSTIDVAANLDSTASVLATAWTINNPGTTSNFSTAITVYDTLGNSHRVDIYFRKIQDADPSVPQYGRWDYHALVDGSELQGGVTGTPVEMGAGYLEFTADGWLNDEIATTDWDSVPPGTSMAFRGASPQAISFDFGENINTDGGTGQTGTTQYASSNSIRSQEQDGYSTGELAGLGIQGTGDVFAVYSNGEQRLVGKVAIAIFKAEEELARVGEGLWSETQDSGYALVGYASAGAAGAITAGTLEMSTVDLANEFVNLISYQRGFQANSRTISTADQCYQELVNLKR
ncbi:MAG: flagellar hook protein FlgE [Proteobacteria bacterium]|nr:flagellar hook protein FlgE [Pseudomonadota bacterium]